MRIPFHLRRTLPRPAEALLLPAESVAELLALCARLGGDRLPAIHAVAGGFLVLVCLTGVVATSAVLRSAVPTRLREAEE